MSDIGSYIFTVAATALICGLVSGFFKNCGIYKLIRLICNLIVLLCVLSPLKKMDFNRIPDLSFSVYPEKNGFIAEEIQKSSDWLAEVIKTKTETYIVDKAAEMGVTITAKVTLSNDSPPVPAAVEMIGSIAPYWKLRLEELIQEELNISKENQKWTG